MIVDGRRCFSAVVVVVAVFSAEPRLALVPHVIPVRRPLRC